MSQETQYAPSTPLARALTAAPAGPTAPVDRRPSEGAPRGVASWVLGYRRRAALLDALVAVLGVAGAVIVGRWLAVGGFTDAEVAVLSVAVPLAWLGALLHSGAYELRAVGVGTDEYTAMPRAAVRLLAVGAVGAALTYDVLPGGVQLLALVTVPVALVGSLVARYRLRQRLHRARLHDGAAMQRTVVLGAHEAVLELVEDMHQDPSRGLSPVATCTSGPRGTMPGAESATPLAHVTDTIDRVAADVVVVAHPSGLTPMELRRLSWELEERDVELMVSPGIMEVAGPRLSIRPSASLSLVHVESPTCDGGALAGKAIFDRVAALFLVLLTLPLVALVALAIKLDDRGPVLFRQTRVGTRGEPFRIFKFRTMVPDAEDRLAEVREQISDGNGVLFKARRDPRTTKVGAFLRRYSLDELPQLWNVLRGDMSLVGPRPPLQSEVETYEPDAIRRLRVRPGMTGLWQVSGRSDLSWEESLRLDLRYVDNWSLMLDLQILWRTVRAVLHGDGAY